MKILSLNLAGFIITVALIFSPSICSSSQLQLDITTSDTSYLICQSIWLDVQVTNITKDTVRIWGLPFPCDCGFNIVVINERGDTLRSRLIRDIEMRSGFLLDSAQTYYYCFDITEFFHNYEPQVSAPYNQFTRSLAPGRYQVCAEYSLRHPKITTPKISFDVIEPTGPEAEALKLYQGAYQDFLRKDSELMEEKLKKIIATYPKSVYAERAYWILFKSEQLLEKFPDSGFNLSGLRRLVRGMTKERRQTFLQQTIKKHPETRSSKFAEQMLRGW